MDVQQNGGVLGVLFCFTVLGGSSIPDSRSIQTGPVEVRAVGGYWNPLWQVTLIGILTTEAIRKAVEINNIVRRTQ
jgi:hypothetical protein